MMLSTIEIIFGVTSTLSIVCSCLSIWMFNRQEIGSSNATVSPKDIQRWGFWFFIIYHVSMFVAFYLDMIIYDGQTTFWNRNLVYAWPQLIVYVSFDSLIVIWYSWLIYLWVKVTPNHSLGCFGAILTRASNLPLLFKFMKRIVFLVVLAHAIILAISFEDLGRTLILSSLLMAGLLIPLIVSCVIVIGRHY